MCTDRGSGDPRSVSWDGEALSPRACPDLILTLMVIGRVTDHRHRLQQKREGVMLENIDITKNNTTKNNFQGFKVRLSFVSWLRSRGD